MMEKPPSRRWMRFQWKAHRFAWDLSGGRLGRRAIGMPVLELVTIGNRTGDERSILITYVVTPTGPALAGTNAGAGHDPAWVRNLRKQPAARIRRNGRWSDVSARFLEGAERDEVWRLFAEHRGYADYEQILVRDVPVVVLEST